MERFLPRSPQRQRQRDATHSQHHLQHPSEAHKEKEEAAEEEEDAGGGEEKDEEEDAAGYEEWGEQRAHEPFYLDVEPKGGWTMTDLVGFPFSSDIDMLHHRWKPSSKQVLIEP